MKPTYQQVVKDENEHNMWCKSPWMSHHVLQEFFFKVIKGTDTQSMWMSSHSLLNYQTWPGSSSNIWNMNNSLTVGFISIFVTMMTIIPVTDETQKSSKT